MLRKSGLFVLIALLLAAGVLSGSVRAQDQPERYGVAIRFDDMWEDSIPDARNALDAFLRSVPVDWRVPEGLEPQFEVILTPGVVDQHTCHYANLTSGIEVTTIDVDVRVLDAATGQIVANTLLEGPYAECPTYISGPRVSAPDAIDFELWLRDTLSGRGDLLASRLTFVLREARGADYVLFSDDGRYLLTRRNSSYVVTIWDARSGTLIAALDHRDQVRDAVFSPDSRYAASGDYGGLARIWDAATGGLLSEIDHDDSLQCVAFSPDSMLLATCSGSSLFLWDVQTGAAQGRLDGHTGTIFSAAFSSDGQRIVTGSGDDTARVWDVVTGDLLYELTGHQDLVSLVEFSADNRWIVTASNQNDTIRVWDAQTGALLRALNGKYPAFSLDGGLLAFTSNSTIVVVNVTTGERVLEVSSASHPVFSPDGHLLFAIQSRVGILVDLATGETLARLGPIGPNGRGTFSPDGRVLVTVGDVGRVWDISDLAQTP